MSYEEGPKSLEPQPSARSAATPKHPDRTAENFLQRPEGRMKHKRSVAPGSRRISKEWRRVNGSEGGAPSDGLRFLRQLKDLSQGSRTRRDVCTQVRSSESRRVSEASQSGPEGGRLLLPEVSWVYEKVRHGTNLLKIKNSG